MSNTISPRVLSGAVPSVALQFAAWNPFASGGSTVCGVVYSHGFTTLRLSLAQMPILQRACDCRLARMVRHPVVAEVSKAMLSFNSPSQIYLHHFPELVGVTFGSLNWHFPDGLVLGLMNRRNGNCRIAPDHQEEVSYCSMTSVLDAIQACTASKSQ